MSTQKLSPAFGPGKALRRTLVSGFVVGSYLAYAVHQQIATSAQAVAGLVPSLGRSQTAQVQPQAQAATASGASQATGNGQYQDGTFTGPSSNAFYGQVQVQVVISGGKISSVTALNYPQDRRTSARINSFAVPQLQSEAVQAQSANVDVVSGATLTSQAFMQSLQGALNSALG